MKAQRFPLPAIVAAIAAVAMLCAAPAAAQSRAHAKAPDNRALFAPEQTRLKFSTPSASTHTASSGGSSILRTIVGLLIVIALIYGIAWVMRRVRKGREGRVSGNGLAAVATLPLGGGRTLHLVRAAQDLILVGASEHGVTPIRTYTEEEARANGLLAAEPADERDDLPGGDDLRGGGDLRGAGAEHWPPASDWRGGEQWRALSERPTPIERVLENLRRLTVRS